MRAYLAVLKARFQSLLQYRAAAIAGLATQVFWGLLRVAILTAFYQGAQGDEPLRLEQVVSYVWLGQCLFRLLPYNTDAEIRQMVEQGAVAYELARPVDLYNLWYARSLAYLTAPAALRALPMFLLALLFFGLKLPASWASGLAFTISLVGAVFLSATLVNLMHLSLLWTLSGQGVTRLMAVAVWALSGVSLPLPLFPDFLQPLLAALPFSGILDAPLRLYTGHIPPSGAWWVFLHQVAWISALFALGRLLCRRGLRRLVVQGG